MQLKIENIGKVRKANVQLNGLTVIAGENSSGKSTVGKVLFSVVKAVADARINDEKNWERTIDKLVSSLYMRIKVASNRFRNPDIDKLFPIPHRLFTKSLLEADKNGILDEHLNNLFGTIKNINDVSPRIRAMMQKDLENIAIALNNKDNRAATIKTMMEYSIESEFMNCICSYGFNHASIVLREDEKKIYFDVKIENEKVLEARIGPSNDSLIDATYVESPLYIHMLDTLLRADTFREAEGKYIRRSMLPIHIKDLAEKIDGMRMVSDSPIEGNINVYDIINGEFKYDTKTRRMIFCQDGNDISPINVASGIKSFGLVQMLLQTNMINPNKMLIWDEPENHLHPQWQIAFAKILVQLSSMGIPVLVSTHSPYFVQGIRYFAAQQDVEKYVNYYLAEVGKDNLSELRDVTSNLNSLFIKLSQPLNDIMNVDLARKNQ